MAIKTQYPYIPKKDKTTGLDDDFKAMQASLDDSSDKNRNFLIAFLLLLVYIVITLSNTADSNLLLINQQPAPSLFGFKLPLMSFYYFAPLVLLVFHFNLLFNLKAHRTKLEAWLNHTKNDHDSHYHRLRAYLYNMWATHSYQHKHQQQTKTWDQRLLGGIIWLLFSFLPLLLLSVIFWRMNDYQSLGLSSWHLICVLANLALQSYYWPTIGSKNWQSTTKIKNNDKAPIFCLSSFTILILAGRTATLLLAISSPQKLQPLLADSHLAYLVPHLNVSKLTLNQQSNSDNKVTSTAFINKTIDWTNLTKIPQCKIEQNYQKIDLSNRHLNLINLSDSLLCNVDFANSQLQNANLSDSILAANFTSANLSHANLSHTKLQQGSQLLNTKLDHSQFNYTITNGVNFTLASIQNAIFLGAELAYSHLIQTKLNHSQFTQSNLRLANLLKADFDNSQFHHTPLLGVDLRFSFNFGKQDQLNHSPIEQCYVDNKTMVNNVELYKQSNCKLHQNIAMKIEEGSLRNTDTELKIFEIGSDFIPKRWEEFHQQTEQLNDLIDLTTLTNQLIKITELSQSEYIDLSHLYLNELPPKLLELKHLKRINLSDNLLRSDQVTLLISHFNQLQGLDLSNNQITSLPTNFNQFDQLQELYLNKNRLTNLPDSFTKLSQLQYLALTYFNQLKFDYNI